MLMQHLGHGGAWRARLRVACLVATLATLWPFGTAHAAVEPTLTLTPNQAPCGTTIAVRGEGFPPGDAVQFTLPGNPKRPPAARDAPSVTGADDGTFTIALVPCTAETPGYDQEGTPYLIGAATATPDPLDRPRAFASATFTVGPVAQVPDPTLTLTPDRGACNSTVVFRGANFPPGATVLFSAFPGNSDNGVQFGPTTVGADGGFAVEVQMRRVTACSIYNPGPVGTQYRIGAQVDRGRGQFGAFARASYTVAEPRVATRCFAETGRCVGGLFHEYWERGGLPINGYPISDQFVGTLEDGNEYLVQYFERVRLEYHPENQSPYDVLLGQFGRRLHPADPPGPSREAESTAAEPVVYVPQIGHNLRGRFLSYFENNGGLPQFGFPISEEFEEELEDGNRYTVQYFERARLEYHPENTDPRYQVLLGQFGRRILAETAR